MRLLALLPLLGCGRIAFDPSAADAVAVNADARFTCAAPTVRTGSVPIIGTPIGLAIAAGQSELAIATWLQGSGQIAVQRVSRDLAPVGSVVRLAAEGPGGTGIGIPDIVANGSGYAVIRAVVGASGIGTAVVTTLDTAAIPGSDVTIDSSAVFSGGSRLAWNGTGYGAAWDTGTGSETGAWFAPLDVSATRLGTGSGVSGSGDCVCTPAVTSFGAEWDSVVANDGLAAGPGYQIGLTRLASDGSIIAGPLVVSGTDRASAPDIANDGASFVVVYLSDTGMLVAAHVEADGSVSSTARTASTRAARITSVPGGYAAAYENAGALLLWPLDATGVPTSDPAPIASVGTPDAVAIAALGSTLYVVWLDAGSIKIAEIAC